MAQLDWTGVKSNFGTVRVYRRGNSSPTSNRNPNEEGLGTNC